MKFQIGTLLLLILGSCQTPAPAPGPSAEEIIARAQQVHGSQGFEGKTISFHFRDRQYRINHENGRYEYGKTPVFPDSTLLLEDVLNNGGFRRAGPDGELDLSEEDIVKYSASLNSVVYFAQLPLGLEAEAVNAELLGEVTIKDETYYKVRVTFSEAGGGEDFEDIFLYYFSVKAGTVDYLAYTYAEEHGRGLRFREAINRRKIDGIVFQDYVNYSDSPENDFLTIEQRFASGSLRELSRILSERIEVR